MVRFVGGILLLCLLLCGTVLAEPLLATGYDTETVLRSWETNAFFPRMAELTGVEVTGHAVTEEKDYQALLAKTMAGEPQADILFKASLTRQQEISLIDSGAVLDLAPLIEKDMPNLSALLAEHPEWREQIALEDGRIASLPLINLHERQVCAWLNAAWLESLGVAFPESLDELTEAFRAIAEKDPNGNGKKDEHALDLVGVYELRWLLPYFGIVADDYHVCRNGDGELVFAPDQAGYRRFAETVKNWYDLGLMRPDAFTATHTALSITTASNQNSDKKQTNTSGMLLTVTPYTAVDADEVSHYRALLLPDENGKVRWRDLLGELWTGTFAVTASCKDPDAALRWVDALYTEKGAALAYVGIEGEEYVYNAEGYWEYKLQESSEIEAVRANKIIYTGTTVPGLFPDRIIEAVNSEEDRHVFAESERVHACSERVLRNYFLPASITTEVSEICTRLGALVDTGLARFITGEVPLDDEHWNAWLDSLHEAGSARLVELLHDR
ncbi:MAG: extracellular solute-binding protein [Clostridia bacterium]|nr:extracellular solute-binding protein [Clostridia bacterium]